MIKYVFDSISRAKWNVSWRLLMNWKNWKDLLQKPEMNLTPTHPWIHPSK